jgi:U3 small nucleolar ribonucleoprotein protein IMP4
MLTTSRDPSNRLQQFVKELNLIFPNAHRLNRGSYIMKDLVHLSQKNSISDIVIVHEHRGVPDGLVISHMPLGPTVYFALKDVVLRHDLPNKPPPMSTAFPHLIFDNLTSTLGTSIPSLIFLCMQHTHFRYSCGDCIKTFISTSFSDHNTSFSFYQSS